MLRYHPAHLPRLSDRPRFLPVLPPGTFGTPATLFVMTDMIQTIFRTALLVALAIAGFTLAIIVMLGTALVIGFLYLRAKITGKPFLGQTMWARRPTAARWGFPRQPGATGPDVDQPVGTTRAPSGRGDIIDVEVREIR